MVKTKLILFILLILLAYTAKGHQTDISSTVLVENEDNSWMLSVRSAMTAFEYEVKSRYGEKSFKTPEEFQALVLEYMKENISISYNGSESVSLENGYVKLGHETAVIFQVVGTPKNIDAVTITNSSFKNIRNSQSALVVLKNGFSKDQFILNEKNGHSAQLKVSGTKFISETIAPTKQSSLPFYFLIGGLIAFLVVSGFILYKKQPKNKTKNSLVVSFRQDPKQPRQHYK